MAASKFHAIRNAQKREKRIELLKTRSDRAEKRVQFSRSYKDGEFPDIEIPRSAVVNPLKILGKVSAPETIPSLSEISGMIHSPDFPLTTERSGDRSTDIH